MNILSIILFVFLFSATALSNPIRIQGTTKNASDNSPVEWVNISVLHKGVGTISNENGEFLLILSDEHAGDSILFSCIGFETQSYLVQEITGNAIKVVLKPISIKISQATIVGLSPGSIVKSAFGKIGINHPSNLTQHRIYARQIFKENGEYTKLLEAEVDAYVPGYSNITDNNGKLIMNTSRASFDKSHELINYNVKPIGLLRKFDLPSFASYLNYFDTISYALENIAIYDLSDVYKVSFSAWNLQDTTTSCAGTFFIEKQSHAFISIQYIKTLGIKHSKKGYHEGFVTIDYSIDKNLVRIDFSRKDSTWYVKYIQDNFEMNIYSQKKSLDIRVDFISEYLTSNIDMDVKDYPAKNLCVNMNKDLYDQSAILADFDWDSMTKISLPKALQDYE